jgi:hypothetical protein
LPHISIAGACTTATHGSGDKNGNLSSAVSALEMVTASGEGLQLSRKKDSETFHGAVVGLGALGVITKITLDIQPTYMEFPPSTRMSPADSNAEPGCTASFWKPSAFRTAAVNVPPVAADRVSATCCGVITSAENQ